eukprot:7190753-Pyramimonas_sp.AAC.1
MPPRIISGAKYSPRPPRETPPLQIDRTGLPGAGSGEGEASHTPMNPKGPGVGGSWGKSRAGASSVSDW